MAVVLLARTSQRNLQPDPDGGAWLENDQYIGIYELYLNVVLSQLLVVGVIIGLLWITVVPADAMGSLITDDGHLLVGIGIVLGVGLYLANELSVFLLDRLGIDYSEALRGSLAPASPAGWFILLVIVLPVIAVAEELLFRAVLIGGLAASIGIDPWILIILSSVVFSLGHGIQGTGGIIVTGGLGIVLGVAFVLSQSLLLVIVAHYVVNALEFVINEGLSMSWISTSSHKSRG